MVKSLILLHISLYITHALHNTCKSPRIMPLCTHTLRTHRGGGHEPLGVGGYVYMDIYTDEENEVLTTVVTVDMYAI